MWQSTGGIRTLLIRVALLLCLLEVAYVVGANAFLGSRWARVAVNRKPDKLTLGWIRAWTWFPGIVHVTGLTMRAQTRRVQWYSTTERARISVDLFPLTLRCFQARSVRGEGVTFLLRRRLDTLRDPLDATEAETWPEIPGLANPPAEPPHGPRSKRPWTLRIHDARLERVRTIWVDSLRIEGEGTAKSDLEAKLGRSVEIERASLRMPNSTITIARKPVTDAAELDVVLSIDEFSPKGTTFRKLWPLMSGELRCTGGVSSFDFLNLYLERVPWLHIDGSGPLDLRLVARHGELEPGTRLAAAARVLDLRILSHAMEGSGVIRGDVFPGAPPKARLEVDVADFALRRGDADDPYVRGNGFKLVARSEDNDFREGMPELDLILDLPESRVARFEVYGEYLPAATGFRVLSGSGQVRGRVELSTRTMTGSGEVVLEGTTVKSRFEELPIRGDVALRIALAPLDRGQPPPGAAPAFALSGAHLDLRNVVTGDEPQKTAWSGDVDFGGGEIVARPLRVSTPFSATLQDTRPILAVFAERSRWVDLFEGFLNVANVQASGRLTLDESSASVDGFDLRADGAEMQADLDFSKRGRRGLLYARKGLLRFAVEMTPAGRTWKVAGARDWFEKKRAERGSHGPS